MKQRSVTQGMFPIWSVGNARLIMASTIDPSDRYNFWTRLITACDANGKTYMNVSRYVLVCDECRDKYVGVCPHSRMLQPVWRESSKTDILQHILPENDRRAEMEGGLIDGESGAFRTEDINWLMDPRNMHKDVLPHVPFIFVAVDPNAGGQQSAFSICSHIVSNGKIYIVGLEDKLLKDPGNEGVPLVWSHLQCLSERFPELSDATIVLGVESVMGSDSVYIHNAMRSFPRPIIIYHNPSKPLTERDGIYTDNKLKYRMVRYLSHELSVHHILLVSRFVTVDTFGNKHLEFDPTIAKTLTEELFRFNIIKKVNETTGKLQIYCHGKSNSNRDDLVMAVMMSLEVGRNFRFQHSS